MKEKNREIELLKGLSAFAVCSGHTFDAFVWYSTANCEKWKQILSTPPVWNLFQAGGIAVIYFCLISGWCAANKKINGIYNLFRIVIRRYLNIVSIVLITNLMMSVLSYTYLFDYNEKVAVLVSNSSITRMNYESYPLLFGVVSSFAFKIYNGAMWMLPYLFFGNVIIYCMVYVLEKYIWRIFCLGMCGVAMVVSYYINPLVFVTVSGGIAYIIIRQFTVQSCFKKLQEKTVLSFITAIVLLFMSMMAMRHQIPGIPYYIYELPICGVALITSLYLLRLDLLSNSMLLRFLGKNNMSIFQVHIPVIYTFGTGLALKICPKVEYGFAVFIIWGSVISMVLIIAPIYCKYIDLSRIKLLKSIDRVSDRLLRYLAKVFITEKK